MRTALVALALALTGCQHAKPVPPHSGEECLEQAKTKLWECRDVNPVKSSTGPDGCQQRYDGRKKTCAEIFPPDVPPTTLTECLEGSAKRYSNCHKRAWDSDESSPLFQTRLFEAGQCKMVYQQDSSRCEAEFPRADEP